MVEHHVSPGRRRRRDPEVKTRRPPLGGLQEVRDEVRLAPEAAKLKQFRDLGGVKRELRGPELGEQPSARSRAGGNGGSVRPETDGR